MLDDMSHERMLGGSAFHKVRFFGLSCGTSFIMGFGAEIFHRGHMLFIMPTTVVTTGCSKGEDNEQDARDDRRVDGGQWTSIGVSKDRCPDIQRKEGPRPTDHTGKRAL